jgi:flagellar protein FlaF
MSVRGYEKAQETIEDPRAMEHRMLARVTGMLIEGGKRGGRDLVEACFYNRKLWTIFQADCASPSNQLPDPIKASVISLSIWVQSYTGQVLSGASVDPLVEVNRSIMEGLVPAAPAAMQAATAPRAPMGALSA